MKRTFISITILSLLLAQSCVFDLDNGVSGSGNVKSEVIDVDGFTGVHASSGIDVILSQGDFYVEVVADENLHTYITVEREGKMLRIGSEKSIRRAESKLVKVSLPDLRDIKISSAGDIEADTDFKCENLDISISSAGDLDLDVDAKDVRISISSSGDCDIRGFARELDARLSSAGDLNAFDLEADYVSVTVSSAGDAKVTANREIEMSASSAGNIYYRGDAKVLRSNSSSAGSIIRR